MVTQPEPGRSKVFVELENQFVRWIGKQNRRQDTERRWRVGPHQALANSLVRSALPLARVGRAQLVQLSIHFIGISLLFVRSLESDPLWSLHLKTQQPFVKMQLAEQI